MQTKEQAEGAWERGERRVGIMRYYIILEVQEVGKFMRNSASDLLHVNKTVIPASLLMGYLPL